MLEFVGIMYVTIGMFFAGGVIFMGWNKEPIDSMVAVALIFLLFWPLIITYSFLETLLLYMKRKER